MAYRTVLIASLCFASTAKAADGLNVYGAWLNEKKTSIIEITDCSGAPCGEIVWIDHPEPDSLLDTENPDPDLRKQPLLGLTILSDFQARKNQWRKGRIYDPVSGNTYRSRLRRREDDTLEVKGCIGPLCQTQIWTPSPL